MVRAYSFVFFVLALLIILASCSNYQHTLTLTQSPVVLADTNEHAEWNEISGEYLVASGDSFALDAEMIRSKCTDFILSKEKQGYHRTLFKSDERLKLLLDELSNLTFEGQENANRINQVYLWCLTMSFPHEENIEIRMNEDNTIYVWIYNNMYSYIPPGLSVKPSGDEANRLNELFSSCYDAARPEP